MATGGFRYWQSGLIVGVGVFLVTYGASRLVETVDSFALVLVYIGVVTAVTAALSVPVQTELFVWVLLGTITGAFSASCAVLARLKAAERRLTRRLTMSADQ